MNVVVSYPSSRARRHARHSTILALFVLTVGLILGALPGWETCFAAWAVLGGFILLGTAVGLFWCSVYEAASGHWREALRDLAQIAVMVVATALFWPMHYLSHVVMVAGVYSELKDAAAALPNDGGPRFAWRETNENGYGHDGFAYDSSDEILKPVANQSAAWRRRVDGTLFAGKCWSAERVTGHFYRWNNDGCT